MTTQMRIAFLTPEFVTDYPDGGGLGNYLNRMTELLVQAGHDVELFLPSELEPRVLIHNGVRVERVPYSTLPVWLKAIRKFVSIFRLRNICGESLNFYAQSLILSQAMERRHQSCPFDMVQSADYRAVGLTVKKRPNRVHVIRCSAALDLYQEIDGVSGVPTARRQRRWEFAAIRRAEVCYAPCRFTAEHYSRTLSRHVDVIRPPRANTARSAAVLPFELPDRYVVHFGQLIRRKGTEWLVKALAMAFKKEPSLRIVFVGPADPHSLSKIMRPLLAHRDKVLLLYPMPKHQVLKILQDSEAAILPSLVDNLPNTVIESLSLGIPVIGTQGASIDELVEDGVTGTLVAAEDTDALCDAILKYWRADATPQKGFVWSSETTRQMDKENAIQNLLSLCVHHLT